MWVRREDLAVNVALNRDLRRGKRESWKGRKRIADEAKNKCKLPEEGVS